MVAFTSSAPTTSVLPLIADTLPACRVSTAVGVNRFVLLVQVTTPSTVSVCSTRFVRFRSATLTLSTARSAAASGVVTTKPARPCTISGSVPLKSKMLPPTTTSPDRAVVALGVYVPLAMPSPAMRSVSPPLTPLLLVPPSKLTNTRPAGTPCSKFANARSSPAWPLSVNRWLRLSTPRSMLKVSLPAPPLTVTS